MSTTLHMRISCCMGLGPEQQHNKCLTASTATTYSSALLEKVFLHPNRVADVKVSSSYLRGLDSALCGNPARDQDSGTPHT